MQVRDELQKELRVAGHGLVAGAEEREQLLPVLERVVVLPDQEADEGELKLAQDLAGPEKKIEYYSGPFI